MAERQLKSIGYLSIDLASVGGVFDAEARLKELLVTQPATMKPCGASGEEEEREPATRK